MSTPFILKPTESRQGKALNVLGMPVYLKLAGSDTANQLSVFIAEYGKNQGPPLHAHDVDEWFYVLEGEHIFQANDQRFIGKPGDSIFVPRNTPHTTLCISDGGKLLFTVNATGPVERMFEKLDAYTQMPSVEELIQAHAELGIEILGPPIQP
ncbi:MAG TPA: cupin domain-containing protein [Niabella sp.]|nr:cupin domain-containing protein [Niabella sp.]HOZ96778.1 cupin domain-containing protein [Niabella sp.]HQW14745.1 cupin domain-containing protein [Niabella sp.]HQX20003.1 cupin domain-containing protein [Niabella sp.]HQX40623.1 cupin domain-containing protein [Niabella sp.]